MYVVNRLAIIQKRLIGSSIVSTIASHKSVVTNQGKTTKLVVRLLKLRGMCITRCDIKRRIKL